MLPEALLPIKQKEAYRDKLTLSDALVSASIVTVVVVIVVVVRH